MIFVDPRYGSARPGKVSAQRAVASALRDAGLEVVENAMPFGDFAFIGSGPDDTAVPIGIEMKTVQDFITSMLSGRLAEHQVPGLLDTYKRVYLIIEGFYRSRRGSGLLEVPAGGGWRVLQYGRRPVLWADVERFITSLEEAGVRVRRTRTSRETASVIATTLYPFWQKDYAEHRTLRGLYVPAPLTLVQEDEATARLRRVCVALKTGIGYGRSKAVAEHFRSIANMVNAEIAVWEGIPGVGPQIAAQTRQALHEGIPAQAARAGRVSARGTAAPRSVRPTRVRAHNDVAAGGGPQRRVRTTRAGARTSRRGQPK